MTTDHIDVTGFPVNHCRTPSAANTQGVLFRTIAVAALLGTATAGAQTYPARPVRIVVPYLSGGAGDGVARALSQRLTATLGQSVYIDNRPGGGTKIGTDIVAKSPPNGLTLLMATNAIAINVALYPKLPYDAQRDFAPVVLIDISPNVLVVHPALPVTSVRDLIALAKARPGEINFGSSGIAGSVHFAGELFKSMAAINIVHVPYRGFSQVLTDLLSGQVPMSFSTLQSALPQLKAQRLRALAITSAKRSASAPDMPTIAEAALPGYEMVTWHALLAPAGTPADIIARLNRETAGILQIPEVRKNLESLGMDLMGTSAAALGELIDTEIIKYRRLVESAGIRAE